MNYSIIDNNMINTTMMGPGLPEPEYTITSTDTTTVSNGSGLYWGTNGTSAGFGQVLTTNTNGSWGNIMLADPDIKGSTLQVKGDADFDGEVTIKGKSLTDMFEKIDERLAILHPNPELEEKWGNLRALRNAYKELEAEIIEKEKVWAILNK